jgi:hypothetical protein
MRKSSKTKVARKQPLRSLLKRVRRSNLHPEIGLDKLSLGVRLSPSQLLDMKKLARASGTTVLEQIDRAIEAYLLGISRKEIALLHALVAGLERSTDRANKARDEVLRKPGKTVKHPTGKRYRGSAFRATSPKYPPDDGPLTEVHLAAIRKLVPQGSVTNWSSHLFEQPPRSRKRAPKPRAPAGRRR